MTTASEVSAEQVEAAKAALRALVQLDQDKLRSRQNTLAEVRAALGPVVWVEELQSFLVLGYEECKEAVKRTDVFSSAHLRGKASAELERSGRLEAISSPEMADLREFGYGGPEHPAGLVDADPPVHTRQRALVSRPFLPRRVASFEPILRSIATDLLDDLALTERADFVDGYTRPLIARFLLSVLGLPEEDLHTYYRWGEVMLIAAGKTSVTPEERARYVQMRKEFDRYFIKVLTERREHPGDDFMTDLVQGAAEGDEPLTLDELLWMLGVFIRAAEGTTKLALASAIVLLVEHPDVQQQLRDDPELIPAFVEEALRRDGPASALGRLALSDCELAGVTIPAGSTVLLMYGSADYDEAQFACPHDIDLHRENPRSHLSLGYGIHYCIGHAVARLAMRVGIEELLDRLDDLRFDEGTDRSSVPYLNSMSLRGPDELWLRYSCTS